MARATQFQTSMQKLWQGFADIPQELAISLNELVETIEWDRLAPTAR